MMKLRLSLLLLVTVVVSASAQTVPSAEEVLQKSIVVHDGLRLPKTRRWFMNADDAYLGADVIEAYERPAPDGP